MAEKIRNKEMIAEIEIEGSRIVRKVEVKMNLFKNRIENNILKKRKRKINENKSKN